MNSIIEVNELVKRYEKAKEPAVKGVSFQVGEGDFFAFLGPNRRRQNHDNLHIDHYLEQYVR